MRGDEDLWPVGERGKEELKRPQTHFVRARTDTTWDKINADGDPTAQRVKGKLWSVCSVCVCTCVRVAGCGAVYGRGGVLASLPGSSRVYGSGFRVQGSGFRV